MSDFNIFVSSNPATTIFDATVLRDHGCNPSQDYWVFSRAHSLSFYKSDIVKNDSPLSESRPYGGDLPYFSMDLHADIQRMLRWAPPHGSKDADNPPTEGLLLLTESCVLHLVLPDFKERNLRFISKVDLNDVKGFKIDGRPLIALDPSYQFLCAHIYKSTLDVIRIQKGKSYNNSTFLYRLRPSVQLRLPQIYPIDIHFGMTSYRGPDASGFNLTESSDFRQDSKRRRSNMLTESWRHTAEQPCDNNQSFGTAGNDLFVLFSMSASENSSIRRINLSESINSTICQGGGLGIQWSSGNDLAPKSAELIFPLAGHNILVFGTSEISVVRPSRGFVSVNIPQNMKLKGPLVATSLNVARTLWLLGDAAGRLLLVGLEPEGSISGESVASISFSLLGLFSPPSCMAIVGTLSLLTTVSRAQAAKSVLSKAQAVTKLARVFIGSMSGDSMILDILMGVSVDDRSSAVEVSRFANLGPIVDLVPVDFEGNGRIEAVLACGFGITGSLRVATPGVGVTPLVQNFQHQGTTEFIRGIFPVSRKIEDQVSTVGFLESGACFSRLRQIRNDAFSLVHIEPWGESNGFYLNSRTLLCGMVARSNLIFQVTPCRVRILDSTSFQLLDECVHPFGIEEKRIEICSTSQNVLCLASGSDLVVLQIQNTGSDNYLLPFAKMSVQTEVAAFSLCAKNGILALIDWDNHLHLYRIERRSIMPIHHDVRIEVEPSVSPTSLALEYFEPAASYSSWSFSLYNISSSSPQLFLIIGFSDGSLLHAKFSDQPNSENNPLTDIKYTEIGSTPIFLYPIARSETSIEGMAVCCNYPAVIFLGASHRLQTTALGIHLPNCITKLDLSEDKTQTCIAWAGEGGTNIGLIERIQRLQIRTLPLGMSPERVAFHTATKTIVAGCYQETIGSSPIPAESSEVGCLVLTAPDFKTSIRYDLDADEIPSSLICCYLGDDSRELIVVGSQLARKGKEGTGRGCIRILNLTKVQGPGNLENSELLLHELVKEETDGVMAIKCIDKKLLVGLGAKAKLYTLCSKTKPTKNTSTFPLGKQDEVSLICLTTHGTDFICDIDICGSSILLGSLSRSLNLYNIKEELSPGVKARVSMNQPPIILSEIAADYNPIWPRAIACPSENHFLEADDSKNIIALAPQYPIVSDTYSGLQNGTPHTENGIRSSSMTFSPELKQVGLFHCGETINRLVVSPMCKSTTQQIIKSRAIVSRRNLFNNKRSSSLPRASLRPSTFWASVDGALGVIIPVEPPQFHHLTRIQSAVAKIIETNGALPLSVYRDFFSPPRHIPHRGFIDGDTVEKLLDMEPSLQHQVFNDLNVLDSEEFPSLNTLLREVEELQRSHF